jgi:S-disulfanyl-L-cysteine oxidoreductase SoxD
MRARCVTKTIFAAALLCPLLLVSGCRAKQPTSLERFVVTRAKHWVTVRGKSAKNPLTSTAETVDDGRKAFLSYCAACHGLDGQNTGVPFAEKVSPPIPSLASKDVQDYSDGQLKWVIDNGIFPSGMPASEHVLSDEEIWSIVLFIRHLPPAGSQGEPPMYSGDSCDPKSQKPPEGH